MRALTVLVSSADVNYDVETAIVLIIVCLVAIGFWAAAEFQLRRPANQESIEQDRDAIAETIGLIDQSRGAAYAEDFADEVENRLHVIDGGAS